MTPAAERRVVPSAEAVDRLDVFQEKRDPCAHGHVEHGPEDHLGDRVVHTLAGSFGADWSEASARAFIASAELIVETEGFARATGHGIAACARDGDRMRWVAFATKDDR